ncbi:hypothetical protein [Ekhidna sp.]|uniref:hypothetical protein n=1 Tax=Ekhidna sp. TaxID=2608089 RepID=UPI0032EB04FA
MEITKEQLLAAADVLDFTPEEIQAIEESDEPVYHIVKASTIHESLATIRNLSKENKEQKDDLKIYFRTSKKIGELVDFSSPVKAIAGLTRIMKNPEKYREEIEPMLTIHKKYNDKQLTDGKEKD